LSRWRSKMKGIGETTAGRKRVRGASVKPAHGAGARHDGAIQDMNAIEPKGMNQARVDRHPAAPHERAAGSAINVSPDGPTKESDRC
jgi:hypothetical protein